MADNPEEVQKAKRQEALEIVDTLYEWASQQRFAIGQAAVELAALKILQRHMTIHEAHEYQSKKLYQHGDG